MSVDAADGFQRHRWQEGSVGVPQSRNAYEVLGVTPLEDDLETIRTTASERWVALRAQRHTLSPEAWQEANNELEDAINTLLDPAKKVAYDDHLRAQQGDAGRDASHSSDSTGEGNSQGKAVCPECGASGPARRKFCGNCGTSLWNPCVQCGARVSSAEKFCGACGANQFAGLEEKRERFSQDMLDARRLAMEHRYDEAIASIEPIGESRDARLKSFARQAEELMRQLRSDRERCRTEAEDAFEEAQLLAASWDYQSAVARLEKVPRPLRTEPMETLLATAVSKADEIDRLGEEIRLATTTKGGGDPVPKINRLLALQPNHAFGRQLADRFRDRLLQAAAGRLAKHQYDETLSLLDRVPEAAVDDRVTKLRGHAAELALLKWDLSRAPFADRGLVTAAGRLAKLAPRDPQVPVLVEKLGGRVRRASESDRLGPATWAAQPERTLLGRPIDWATEFRRIEVSPETDLAMLKRHAGCLFVACGLALQGLGLSRTDINLQPGDDGGLLQRARRAIRKRSATTAWGIDVSSGGLKAVKLALVGTPPRVVLQQCEVVEHRKILGQAAGQIEERTLVDETIQTFLSRNELKADRVCLGLPGMMTLCRLVRLPPMDMKKIGEVMQYEVRNHLPFKVGDLIWGYQLADGDEADPAQGRDVLLVAVRRTQLESHLDKLQGLKAEFDVIQSDCLAIHNLIGYEYFGEDDGQGQASPDEAIAVIDAGTETTNFVVTSRDGAWFRNIGVGGHSFTKALARQLNLTFAQAEQMKRDPAQAARMSQVQETLDPLLKDLANETLASWTAYKEAGGKQRIGRYLGMGGTFQMHGLLRFLRTGR